MQTEVNLLYFAIKFRKKEGGKCVKNLLSLSFGRSPANYYYTKDSNGGGGHACMPPFNSVLVCVFFFISFRSILVFEFAFDFRGEIPRDRIKSKSDMIENEKEHTSTDDFHE